MDEGRLDKLRVTLVEDDAATRSALMEVLAGLPGVECLSSHGDGESAWDALTLPGALLPDVVLVDIGLPGMSGIDLVLRLGDAQPALRFLMLTLSEDSQDIFHALRAGAHGYVVKGGSTEELIEAVQDASAGGMPFSVGVARRVREFFMRQPAPILHDSRLSPRESEVLALMARGLLRKEVAAELRVAEHTIRTHLQRIYSKLNVHSSRQAVALFLSQDRQDGAHLGSGGVP